MGICDKYMAICVRIKNGERPKRLLPIISICIYCIHCRPECIENTKRRVYNTFIVGVTYFIQLLCSHEGVSKGDDDNDNLASRTNDALW